MTAVRKGMCYGCPWNYGDPATEMAYNLGCLPSSAEATEAAKAADEAWACHSEADKVCCGYAAANKADIGKPLLHMSGVHAGAAS